MFYPVCRCRCTCKNNVVTPSAGTSAFRNREQPNNNTHLSSGQPDTFKSLINIVTATLEAFHPASPLHHSHVTLGPSGTANKWNLAALNSTVRALNRGATHALKVYLLLPSSSSPMTREIEEFSPGVKISLCTHHPPRKYMCKPFWFL